MKWKHFPSYWPFVRGIHRSPQRPVTRSFDVVFDLRLNKRLSKQSSGWWIETQSRPLWRHRNVTLGHPWRAPTGLFSWWLQMSWRHIGTKSSTTTILVRVWLHHITQYIAICSHTLNYVRESLGCWQPVDFFCYWRSQSLVTFVSVIFVFASPPYCRRLTLSNDDSRLGPERARAGDAKFEKDNRCNEQLCWRGRFLWAIMLYENEEGDLV